MTPEQKVLFVDAQSGFYRTKRYPVADFFGPVDLGLHLAAHHNSLNIGTGLLAGSIIPGSNRLFFSGFSPCWGGFYVSSMGGAGLVFDNLGINMLALVNKAPAPCVLVLNRCRGEEVQVELHPVELGPVWGSGRKGVYSLMDFVFEHFAPAYETEPRILATGPAALATDFGGIVSVPVRKKELTMVDTWAGRGGFGSKMLQQHGIAAIIYGGTFIDDDFRDRTVADAWFEQKYSQKLAAKDLEGTTKYRFDPKFDTGGTFGVNFASLADRVLAFNYRTIYMSEKDRRAIHEQFILNHYLRQFNDETIKGRQQSTCGEPCAAVCKKMNAEFKKDFEPYQAMGPLCGIFDQRAAEMLNHRADTYGFDAISAGGVLAWLLECLHEGVFTPQELGVEQAPKFTPDGFAVEADSMRNAGIGCALLDSIIEKKGVLDLSNGARHFARQQARSRGRKVVDLFVYTAFARRGWMVPNQYWTPGVLSPMPMMGKYYMFYSDEFLSPRELGRKNASRMLQELMLDNFGLCRFHRSWAEEMAPEIVESLWGMKERFLEQIAATASRINSRNSSIFWESARCHDLVLTFLRRKQEQGCNDPDLQHWKDYFERDRQQAALDFWYDMHKGVHETLSEFK